MDHKHLCGHLNQDISCEPFPLGGFLRIRRPLHWRGVWLSPRIVVSVGLSPFWTETWLERMLLYAFVGVSPLTLNSFVCVCDTSKLSPTPSTFWDLSLSPFAWVIHLNGRVVLTMVAHPIFPTTFVEGFWFSDYSGYYRFLHGPESSEKGLGCIFKRLVMLVSLHVCLFVS